MKKTILLLLSAILLSACASTHKVAYFQGIDNNVEISLSRYEIRIAADDVLHISVSALNPEAAAIFNTVASNAVSQSSESLNINGYTVDSGGYINFPVLGRVHLAGMTRNEATDLLQLRIAEYIRGPSVNIRFLNFKVTILGEVAKPGSYGVKGERVTILEALAMAGDMTIYGKRQNVLVCREINGEKEFERINLTSPEIFNSRYYYLQQNDIVYVQPNRARAGSSGYNQNLSLGVSLLSLLVTIVAILI